MKNVNPGFVTLVLFCAFAFFACNNHPTDAELRQQVTDSLQANGSIKNLGVQANDGVVTLTGTCEGDNCAAGAADRLKNLDGVKSVTNNIRQVAQTTDLTLRTQVQSIITKYAGVTADVANGVIVLRGSISRGELQPLMTELSTLPAAKIDNQLAVQ